MAVTHPVTRFGGIPFVDDSFNASQVLAAVVAVRVLRAGEAQAHGARRWLNPRTAAACRLVPADSQIVFREPHADERRCIEQAVRTVIEQVPAWRSLLSIPLQFGVMDRHGVISASSFGYPQHIFLGEDAFASPRETREQVVHEAAHNWIYLIAEICQIERREPTRPDFTLPSGTSGKLPSEVLGALHVAVTLRRLYAADSQPADTVRQRLADLQAYVDGCDGLLADAAAYLTPAGQEILNHLHETARKPA